MSGSANASASVAPRRVVPLGPVIASRTNRSLDEVTALLGGTAVSNDRQLVDLSRRLDQLRQEIFGD